MSDPVPDLARPVVRRESRRLPEIALVGSRSNFTENLICATGQDLRNLSLIHVPSLEVFNAMSDDQTCWLRLVLIDDHTLRNTPPEVLRACSFAPGTSIVLAFLDYELAARHYRSLDKALPIESYVPLNVRLDVWLSILKLLLHGGKYVPEELLAPRSEARAGLDRSHPPDAAALGLTARQYSVLELVAEGLPNKLIAARLGLSDHTVKLHIHNIIARLGVTNRTEAAARFRLGRP